MLLLQNPIFTLMEHGYRMKNKLNIWFEEGVTFKCTGCGKCCTGAPGYVWLTDEDITLLAKKLQITEKEFLSKYTRYINGKYSLKERPVSYDCIFLNGKECTVYEARPKQCKKFPFWQENFLSKEAWNSLKESCEGINHKEGKHYSKEAIISELES